MIKRINILMMYLKYKWILILSGILSSYCLNDNCIADNINLVGEFGGWLGAIAIKGSFAYVREGRQLTTLDLSSLTDSGQIRAVNRLPLPDVLCDLYVADDTAVALSGHIEQTRQADIQQTSLIFLDLSHPQNPAPVGTFTLPNATYPFYPYYMTHLGNTVFLVHDHGGLFAEDGLQIINAANPSSPQLVNRIPLDFGIRAIAASGRLFCLATQHNKTSGVTYGLAVFDATNLNSPTLQNEINCPALITSVAMTGVLAIALDMNCNVWLFDLTDPAKPIITPIPLDAVYPQSLKSVTANGSLAYINSTLNVRVLDLSNTAHPVQIAQIATAPIQLASSDQYLVMACEGTGYQIHQVPDFHSPKPPHPLGCYNLADAVGGVTLNDSQLMIVDNFGFNIFDRTDPTDLKWIIRSTLPQACQKLSLAAPLVGLSGLNGLQFVDITNLLNPRYLGSYKRYAQINDLFISRQRALIATNNWSFDDNEFNYLEVYDISDPTSPTMMSQYLLPNHPGPIAVKDSLALVGVQATGIYLLDISNPNSLKPVAIYQLPGNRYATRIVIHGSIAVVAYSAFDEPSGLLLLDISKPDHPVLGNSCDTVDEVADLSLSGSLIFAAVRNYGVQVFDGLNEVQLQLVGSYQLPGGGSSIAVDGRTIYLGCGQDGLRVLRYTGDLGQNAADTMWMTSE